MYVITGATGNIGSKIAARLINAGKPVRLIGRDENRLKEVSSSKTENAVGRLENVDFLTKAFKDATVVFAMIPPNITAENIREYQNKVGSAITTAIKNAGVKNVVSLSSIGAHLTEGSGVVQGLYDFEQMLNKLENTNVVFLRAGFFMENIFGAMESIKLYRTIENPVKADVFFPMVATTDIATKAAERMLKLDFKGKLVQYVLGPKDLNYKEITKIIGDKIGKPDLKYMETSYESTRDFLVKIGMSKSFANGVVELARGTNEGKVQEDAKRTPQNTTPTTLEEFASTFKTVFNN